MRRRKNKTASVRVPLRFITIRELTVVDDVLDLQHAMFTQLIGNRLSVAPIDTIPLHNVLDIATGKSYGPEYRTKTRLTIIIQVLEYGQLNSVPHLALHHKRICGVTR